MNIQPIGFVDPTMIAATLALRYGEHFDDDTRRQDAPGSAHKRTKVILLRGPENPGPENWMEDVPHIPTDVFREWTAAQDFMGRIERLMNHAYGNRELSFGKIMIVRLEPGGWVDWHRDEGPYAEAHNRFHVCLSPCWGAWLYSGGEGATMTAGNVLAFNNRALHSAANFGDIPRVNLIFDIKKPALQ